MSARPALATEAEVARPARQATALLALAALASLAAGACTGASPPAAVEPPMPRAGPAAGIAVRHWGGMREVLREGRTEGRVELDRVVGPHSIGVGALAGLAAEVTIDRGRVLLSEVLESGDPDGLAVRAPAPGEAATLLVLADVELWSEHALPAVADLAALERAVREAARAAGLRAGSEPLPFRVEGTARRVQLHVLDHACPLADPAAPPPWRLDARDTAVVLVGFHAEGAAGVLTHHGQSSHVHALVAGGRVAGHLDAVALAPGARLYLPAR